MKLHFIVKKNGKKNNFIQGGKELENSVKIGGLNILSNILNIIQKKNNANNSNNKKNGNKYRLVKASESQEYMKK